MKSLQRSLTGYFLVLLVVALGAVSFFVYRNTQITLEEKKDATARLLLAQYEEDCRKENAKFDEGLLTQARTLAQLVQFYFDWSRTRNWEYHPLGVLMASPSPFGYVQVPLWVAEGTRGAVSWELHRQVVAGMKTQIKLKNSDLLRHVDEQVTAYFQINSAWGSVYHSQSLRGRSFSFDPSVFSPKTHVLDWEFDDTRLGPDLQVRRVMLKAPAAARYIPLSSRYLFAPPPRGGRGTERDRDPYARSDPSSRPGIFIQYAAETTRRDETLALFKSNLDQDLARLDQETEASLRGLTRHLLAINGGTFLTALVGAGFLVRRGLLPLRRLSEAVSHVSEKDFRLQIGDMRFPRELEPIVERLTQTLEQLKQACAREKQATADISHELRTPLAALLTTTEVVLRKPRSAEEYREALIECRASAQHIHQAVERLLALARLDAGVDRLRPQPVDVARLAEQCVALVRPLADQRGLKMMLKAETPSPIEGDPDKLREILTNLLHNAIQYNHPEGQIEVTVARNNGHLHLEVSDTGVGISPEARKHIFERFYREDPSRQSDGLHAGLGLAIVKGYVELMGGSIDVASTEGQGSTFSVHLPVARQ